MPTKTKKILIATLLVSLVVMGFFVTFRAPVFAQVSLGYPTSFVGLSSADLRTTIENIVRIVFGFIGFLFLLLLIYAGFLWMTSGGDEKKITRAKKIITSAVIGLLITISAYAIAGFIIRSFTGATSGGGPGGGGYGTGPGGFGFALGSGALESHYPGRNARGIPRNTRIYVTFKDAMNVGTLCDVGPDGTYGTADDPNPNLLIANIIIKEASLPSTAPGLPAVCQPTDATNKTFRFIPVALLGTGNGDVPYTVTLKSGIETADGEVAIPWPNGYQWRFTVSSITDTTPPTVVNTIPGNGDSVPKNTLVQINFSEPVDPTSASGLYTVPAAPGSDYDSIMLGLTNPPATPFIAGTYASSNQYSTTEFTSNESCGANSCGENVYCLPGPTTIHGVVSADIMDMAGNKMVAPYSWQFTTTDDMDLTPPQMIARSPRSTETDWPLGAPIQMDFSKVLSSTSLNSGNVGLGREVPWNPALPNDLSNEGNYWITSSSTMNLDGATDPDPETRVFINHDLFTPLKDYHPGADSQIRDLHQNCYFPATCTIPGNC